MTDAPELIWADQDNLTWVEANPYEVMKDCEAAYVRSDLCASGQQVRALIKAGRAMADAAEHGVVASTLVVNWDNAEAALTPAPQDEQQLMTDDEISEFVRENGRPEDIFLYLQPAATPTAQEAVPACAACEDNPKHPNIPCAVCGAHPPQPSETVAAVIEAANMARNRLEMIADAAWRGDGRDLKRSVAGVFSDFDAALRALKGEE
ncbi:hypothetical protein [Paracoccus versutus]|uniref:Uncharacterized protein n=1 Tax=Paracoccus versutus TaxID=34007 RepID=A0A3D9XIW6_PARVE|nr:hypothetical protein [Paracoccus versutus]REF70370.1 hypothetical protein BDD41_3102 [Paracoccus versutus]REF72347.1 hypothetical protein BDD41_0817 [Paracoccus versutus]WGR55673.1 hypothetical protein E3U25_06755 [Paracoccus versutus]WGR57318.1 hypothetical protein E3U25_15055 [Paracoccus versutus]